MNDWHTKILHSKLEMDEALIKLLTRNWHFMLLQDSVELNTTENTYIKPHFMITEKDCLLLANFCFQQVDRPEFITYVMHQRASVNNLTISYRKKKLMSLFHCSIL